jgi:PAS domain-containing protein
MSRKSVHPTGRESPFSQDEIIVSKTDLKGRITYANDVFVRVSGYFVPEFLHHSRAIVRRSMARRLGERCAPR